MEKIPQNKKESGTNRVVGVESEKEKEFSGFFKGIFENNPKDPREKEHSLEFDGLLERINSDLKEFLARYGIESVSIPKENIHIVDLSKLDEESTVRLKNQATDAWYAPHYQAIVSLVDYSTENKLRLCKIIVHESLHLNSFNSFEKVTKDDDKRFKQSLQKKSSEGEEENLQIAIRRVGFEVVLPDGIRYFGGLNEAITEELAMRFDWEYFSNYPELAGEYKERQAVIESLSRRSGEDITEVRRHVARLEEEKHEEGSATVSLKSYSYDFERSEFSKYLDKLYEKNQSDFNSKEELFDVFAKAAMTGRLLPVARLIEKTYGKGSFRKLGERSVLRRPSEEIQ